MIHFQWGHWASPKRISRSHKQPAVWLSSVIFSISYTSLCITFIRKLLNFGKYSHFSIINDEIQRVLGVHRSHNPLEKFTSTVFAKLAVWNQIWIRVERNHRTTPEWVQERISRSYCQNSRMRPFVIRGVSRRCWTSFDFMIFNFQKFANNDRSIANVNVTLMITRFSTHVRLDQPWRRISREFSGSLPRTGTGEPHKQIYAGFEQGEKSCWKSGFESARNYVELGIRARGNSVGFEPDFQGNTPWDRSAEPVSLQSGQRGRRSTSRPLRNLTTQFLEYLIFKLTEHPLTACTNNYNKMV